MRRRSRGPGLIASDERTIKKRADRPARLEFSRILSAVNILTL